MEIVLIRHGKPIIDTSEKVSAKGFGAWVSEYDMANIDERHKPPKTAIERAKSCAFSVCSDLPRSIESAKLLSLEKADIISPLFRECEMPYYDWAHPKLSVKTWSIVFRLLQLVGFSAHAESYKDIKKRSGNCVDQLTELSRTHGRVVLIGHGTLNWFLHKRLLKIGWQGPKKSTRDHWESASYKFDAQ